MTSTMMSAILSVPATLWDMVGMELFLLSVFCLGYLFFNSKPVQKLLARPGAEDALLQKQMGADFASGNYEDVLERAKCLTAMNLDTLRMVMCALLELGLVTEAWTRAQQALLVTPSLHTAATVHAVLELLACDYVLLE